MLSAAFAVWNTVFGPESAAAPAGGKPEFF